MQQQAEVGYKFKPDASELTFKATFQFYVNEVILGNNSIMVELDEVKHSFINYNVMNYMMTKDQRFTARSYESIQTLIRTSTMISSTGEKYRNKFFRFLHDRVESLRKGQPEKKLLK